MNPFHLFRPAGVLVASMCLLGRVAASTVLFDFGDPGSLSGAAPGEPVTWNDVPTSVLTSDFGEAYDLVTTNGTMTTVGLRMVSRFNGVNENGTTASTRFPSSATRDSLYGNTLLFGGLENVTPVFQLIGLTPGSGYNLTFYASRTGVTDNRETRYTVTGTTEQQVDLNVANNVNEVATVSGMVPNGLGEITVALTPGPNNNNGNLFTYLGVMAVQSVADPSIRLLFDLGAGGATTGTITPDPGTQWNNVVTSVGTDPAGRLDTVVTTNGIVTGHTFQMISRFNGANTAGSTASTAYPASATRDSLFGNVEAFGGLSDIIPEFRLSGLSSALVYRFTFYGSRMGVSDNREARYTVTGANSSHGDLDASNNVDGTVTVEGISPDEAGDIRIRITAGPNNNNANHFTYLGAMGLSWSPRPQPSILVDFGAAATTTVFGTGDTERYWNNVDPSVGGSDTAVLDTIVTASGTATPYGLQMVSRFNGANANGTQNSTVYPAAATRDSLFGNTEVFSGLENVTPIFRMTGLVPNQAYHFTFFASRMSVGDYRETRYTVTGVNSGFGDLNASNNESEVVEVRDIRATAGGEITIALEPGPLNDNGNHFTYLGVMRMDWTPVAPPTPIELSSAEVVGSNFRFTLRGESGKTYRIRAGTVLGSWTDAGTVTPVGGAATFEVPVTDGIRFFQATE